MTESPPPTPGRIFISYRREDTAYPAGWLFDELSDHFGPKQVFKDLDSIELGDDFVEVITQAVGSCDVLLALIGQKWLTITDAQGRRRLDDPDDFVRLEIETALARGVRVIPILVDGAHVPRGDQLPDSLARLARRQALELSPARFGFDTGRLLKVVDRTLTEVRATQEGAASTPPPAKSDRRRWAGRGSTPSIPPPTSANRVLPQLLLGRSQPPGKQSRGLSVRARVLAGAGVGVALIMVIVAIIAHSARNGGGTSPTATPSVEIVDPTPGETVPQEVRVVGQSRNVPPGEKIYIVTLAPDGRYYPNGLFARVPGDGQWNIASVTVGDATNAGETLDLIAVLSDCQAVLEYLEKSKATGVYSGLDELPCLRRDSVTVIRK